MVFVRRAFIIWIIFYGGILQADSWYSSRPEAEAACKAAHNNNPCGSITNPVDTNVCSGNGQYERLWTGTITNLYFSGCWYGFNNCSVTGQTRDINGICSCPTGQEVYNNECVAECPVGTFRLSDGSCSQPMPYCPEIGFNSVDTVPICRQMIPGEPTQCANADNTPVNINDCPSLQCDDGSTVIFPNLCPVTQCPDGFTLESIGEDYGKSCVKAAPSPNQNEACVVVDGSNGTICATPDNENCSFVNGRFVCLKHETTPPDGSTCYLVNNENYCLTGLPQSTETEQTIDNGDGTTTQIKNRQSNVQGEPDTTVTKTCLTATGECTTITTGVSDSDRLAQLAKLAQDIADKGGADMSGVEQRLDDIKAKLDGDFVASTGVGSYTATGKTYEQIFGDFKGRISAAPFVSAASGVFTVEPVGTCPVWSGDIPVFGTIVFDQICSPVMADIWPIIQGVIVACATVAAVMIAFL